MVTTIQLLKAARLPFLRAASAKAMVPLEVTKHKVFQKGSQVCSLVIPGMFMFFSAPGKVSLSGVTMTGQVASKAGHKIFVIAFSPSPPSHGTENILT